MKLFSVEEANNLLPVVCRLVERIQREHRRVMTFQAEAQCAATNAASGGGGVPGGNVYATALMRMTAYTDKLQAYGVQLKDYERGLIDFPSLRDERIVLPCWQLGEGDQVEWWHEIDAGFAGRQPL